MTRYLLLLTLLVSCQPAFTNVIDWWENQDKLFDRYITNNRDHPTLSPHTKHFVVAFLAETEGVSTVTITSGCNRKSDHHGKNCMAMDKYFDQYKGGSIKEWALEYLDKLFLYLSWAESQWDSHLVTICVYPPHYDSNGKLKKNGLHVHTAYNFRGGRCGFINGRQVSIYEALEHLEAVIEGL